MGSASPPRLVRRLRSKLMSPRGRAAPWWNRPPCGGGIRYHSSQPYLAFIVAPLRCRAYHLPMYLPVPGLLLIIVALIAGCALLPPAAPGASSQAATTAQSPPSWRSADELVDFGSQTPPVAASDLDLRLDGSDALRMRLAGRCARSATGSAAGDLGDAFVRELVADLYAGGVDPGVASEAMISAGCGEADVIVRELVAQGGDTAALPVVDRAVAAQGPAAFDAMEQAAAEGLRRWRRATGLEAARISAPLAGADLSYSMIYFPFGGRGDPVERFSSPAQVFGSASPVYGIYTFILHVYISDLLGISCNYALPAI